MQALIIYAVYYSLCCAKLAAKPVIDRESEMDQYEAY